MSYRLCPMHQSSKFIGSLSALFLVGLSGSASAFEIERGSITSLGSSTSSNSGKSSSHGSGGITGNSSSSGSSERDPKSYGLIIGGISDLECVQISTHAAYLRGTSQYKEFRNKLEINLELNKAEINSNKCKASQNPHVRKAYFEGGQGNVKKVRNILRIDEQHNKDMAELAYDQQQMKAKSAAYSEEWEKISNARKKIANARTELLKEADKCSFSMPGLSNVANVVDSIGGAKCWPFSLRKYKGYELYQRQEKCLQAEAGALANDRKELLALRNRLIDKYNKMNVVEAKVCTIKALIDKGVEVAGDINEVVEEIRTCIHAPEHDRAGVCKAVAASVANKLVPLGTERTVGVFITGDISIDGLVLKGGKSVSATLAHTTDKTYTIAFTFEREHSVGAGTTTANASYGVGMKKTITFEIAGMDHIYEILGFIGRNAVRAGLSKVMPDSAVEKVLGLLNYRLDATYLKGLKSFKGLEQGGCVNLEAVAELGGGAAVGGKGSGCLALKLEPGFMTASANIGLTAELKTGFQSNNIFFKIPILGSAAKSVLEGGGLSASLGGEAKFTCPSASLSAGTSSTALARQFKECLVGYNKPITIAGKLALGANVGQFYIELAAGIEKQSKERSLSALAPSNFFNGWNKPGAYTITMSTKSKMAIGGNAQAAKLEGGIKLEHKKKPVCTGTFGFTSSRRIQWLTHTCDKATIDQMIKEASQANSSGSGS